LYLIAYLSSLNEAAAEDPRTKRKTLPMDYEPPAILVT